MYLTCVNTGASQHHHQDPEDQDDDANPSQNPRDEPNLRPRLVETAEIWCRHFDCSHNIVLEQVAHFGNGVDHGDAVEPGDAGGSFDVSPVVGDDEEIGDSLSYVGSIRSDGVKHGALIGQIGVVCHEGQQPGNLGADLVERERE